MYTFDDQLTTDQKLAHLAEWIATEERAIAALADDASEAGQLATRQTRLKRLASWDRLVRVEQQLADPGEQRSTSERLQARVQADWARLTRLELRVAGLEQARKEAQAGACDPIAIAKLDARIRRLWRKHMTAQFALEDGETLMTLLRMGTEPCQVVNTNGKPCTIEAPCVQCRNRAALAGAGYAE